MSTTHLIPIMILDPIINEYREATSIEIEQYAIKNKLGHAKWYKANRVELAKRYMELGQPSNVAWAKAFDEYPNLDKKYRFVIN